MNVVLTFLKHAKRLSKKITLQGTEPYPMAKNFSSQVYQVPLTEEGLKAKYEYVKQHALEGHALQKGPLLRPLYQESRAGLTDKTADATYIVLDFDGLPRDAPLKFPVTSEAFQEVVEETLMQMPEAFHNVSYIATASSSFGMKPGKVSFHVHIFLQTPVHPNVLKQYLTHLNLSTPFLQDNLQLSATGTALVWPLDVSVALNSVPLYIAPPIFEGLANPFGSDEDRFLLQIKDNLTLDISDFIDKVTPEALEKNKKVALRRLRRTKGFNPKQEQKRQVNFQGKRGYVVTNPDSVNMTFVRDNETFVYYNINNGDSNAYYVWKNQPQFVHNFKGEPSFLFEAADPVTYDWHREQFPPVGPDGDIFWEPLAFHDRLSDSNFTCLYDMNTKQIKEVYMTRSLKSINDFYVQYGGIVPENFPEVQYYFDPHTETQIDLRKHFVNKFKTPELLIPQNNLDDEFMGHTIESLIEDEPRPNMDNYVLRRCCQTIHETLYSVTGGDNECYTRLINWLAYILQYKNKTKTAWLLQGVQGTGKGVLTQVMRTILGEYCVQKTLLNLEDDFNLWEENKLLTFIDEFHIGNSKTQNKLRDKLKLMITEPTITLRGIRMNQRDDVPSYNNLIFTSNQYGAVNIEMTDRRHNVCPRQEVPIKDRYPGYEQRVVTQLSQEIPKFASFLLMFEVDTYKAQTPIENEIKEELKLLSETSIAEFVKKFKQGDLPYFIELLTIYNDSVEALRAREILKKWLLDIKPNKPFKVPSENLRLIFAGMFSDRIEPRKFGKMMSHHGLTSKASRCDGQVQRCYETTFTLFREDQLEMVTAHLDNAEIRQADAPDILALCSKTLN